MDSRGAPPVANAAYPGQKVLTFSALGSLQEKHTLSYELEEKQGTWILSLCLLDEQKPARAESVKLYVNRQLAFELRDYLYENAVPIENWQDVLAELLSQVKITG